MIKEIFIDDPAIFINIINNVLLNMRPVIGIIEDFHIDEIQRFFGLLINRPDFFDKHSLCQIVMRREP